MSKVKKIFNSQSKTITSAAILLGTATLASKFLGFIKLRLLSMTFSVGAELDAYTAATKIPDLVFSLLVLGAISSSFIPIFLHYIDNKKEKDGWDFVNNVLNLIVAGTVIISIIGIIFAPQIIRIIAPGFKNDPRRFTKAVILMRILFANPVIFAASSVMGGILRSFKRFLLYALAPLLYNIGIIIGILFFSKWWGIFGVAAGAILGALMHFSIQFAGAIASGFKYRPIFSFRHSGIKKLFKLMIPHIMGIAANQINILIFTFIASRLIVGDIFLFNSTELIYNLPIGIFAISLSIAAFPMLSSLAAKKDWNKFRKTVSETIRQTLFLIIPSSVMIFALRAQIVRIVLGSKNVSWQTTAAASQTLGFLAMGMFAAGLLPLLSRSFYSLNDTFTPFISGLAGVVISAVCGFYFSSKIGVAGLGLAFAMAAGVNTFILIILLRKKLKGIEIKKIISLLFKVIPAAGLMAITIQSIKYIIAPRINMQTFFGVIMQGALAGIAGIVVYCIICLVLKWEEMILFKEALIRRLRFGRSVQTQEIADDIDE